MTRLALPLALAGTAVLLQGVFLEGREVRMEDERCALFLAEPDTADEASTELREEVEKKIKDKKSWFRLVDEKADADMTVELMLFGEAEELKASTQQRAEGTSSGTAGSNLQRPALLDVDEGFYIEFQMTVTDKFRTAMTATGHRRSEAAQGVARHAHTICDAYKE